MNETVKTIRDALVANIDKVVDGKHFLHGEIHGEKELTDLAEAVYDALFDDGSDYDPEIAECIKALDELPTNGPRSAEEILAEIRAIERGDLVPVMMTAAEFEAWKTGDSQ